MCALSLSILSSAYQELKNASQVLTMNNLAGTIISQGRMAMQLEQYAKAADLYSCSIVTIS
ncbi:hypothetical protein CK203_095354 [Vitis vinifera]|uniref:Uncharacterized protein n=1 Tax=Vitis vinifera TaxID=29760 RepID=A0A438E731_VITVI|nr:hypothetical protein CK203_095354 [Vitis vinifera]